MAQVPQALKARLLAMMVLRVVLALVFLGTTTWLQIKGHPPALRNFYPLYAVVAAIGALTIAYALALGRIANLRLFSYLQVTVDIALVTVIVYITGGTESYLQTLYPLSVIGASILLNKRGGFYAASASSIAYGVLIDMDYYGMLPLRFKAIANVSTLPWVDVFTTLSSNILAFFAVAYLSGYLAERTEKVEKRLEEKETDFERLELLNRQIVENITSGLMTIDADLRVTSFNREAERVTGYSFKDVFYRDVNGFFPGIFHTEAPEPPAGSRIERRFLRKDGTEVYLGFSISKGQGGDVAHIIIFQDLTHLKAMEEQLRRDERLKALGTLSVGIAHEIRNPLASISGSIQLLRGDLKLSGEDERLMEIVLRETERLNALITDFLLFARPAPEKKGPVDLSAIIDGTIRLFRNCPEAADIRIANSVNGRMTISGDARQLGQVFWNLFINAAQAMRQGGSLAVTSRLSYLEGLKPAHGMGEGDGGGPRPFVEVSVTDSGTGIRPEHLDRIFDPFFSTKDSGTGLGLALVHRIVESHGGVIEVRSRPGAGTTFTLSFPLSGAQALN